MNIEQAFSKDILSEYFEKNIRLNASRGIDGITGLVFSVDLDERLTLTSQKIFSKRYRFTPYLEIIKSKGRGKPPRIISKPTVRDKIVLFAIKEELHKLFPECVPKRLPNTYIREIKNKISGLDSNTHSYLKIDIKGFYDNLNRDLIQEKLKVKTDNDAFITLIRRALLNKTVPRSYKRKDSLKYQSKVGVPQGLSISNILAEIYMKEFDDYFSGKAIAYFRYVDDILLISSKDNIKFLEEEVDKKLSDIGLSSHDHDDDRKSEKGSISEKFQYLGYEVSSSAISVKESTIIRFIESIVAMFTKFKHNAERQEKESKFLNINQIKEIFILRLNEKITGAINENKKYGWLFYFIEINDIPLLYKLDEIIKNQFERLSIFENKVPEKRNRSNPDGLCSLVRSYYEIRHNIFGGYIHNYNIYETRQDKLSYLVKFGYIAHYDDKSYTDEDIEKMFIEAKKSSLLRLEMDVGTIS